MQHKRLILCENGVHSFRYKPHPMLAQQIGKRLVSVLNLPIWWPRQTGDSWCL